MENIRPSDVYRTGGSPPYFKDCPLYRGTIRATFTRPAMHITVFGTEGGAILDPGASDDRKLTLIRRDGETMMETSPVDIQLPDQRKKTVQEHVVTAIKGGLTPENSAERGLAVMRVIDGIYRSSESGQEIALGGELRY